MRQKLSFRVVVLSIAVAGTLLVLLASRPANRSESGAEQESMENCAKKTESGNGMIWENLSHQFFSSF
jgi:hypothetical protein